MNPWILAAAGAVLLLLLTGGKGAAMMPPPEGLAGPKPADVQGDSGGVTAVPPGSLLSGSQGAIVGSLSAEPGQSSSSDTTTTTAQYVPTPGSATFSQPPPTYNPPPGSGSFGGSPPTYNPTPGSGSFGGGSPPPPHAGNISS